jgi:putative oxidoreductase
MAYVISSPLISAPGEIRTEDYLRRPHLGHIEDALAYIAARSRAKARPKPDAWAIAAIVARYLLALLFLAAGISGFFLVHNPPPAPPGLAGIFQDVFFRSGWVLLVDGMEALVGALLLVNRFVPLALTILAGILFNIYAFHITMAAAGLPAPIIVTALLLLVAWPLRSHFAPLLAARAAHQP